jgi:hypothetical protein
MPLAIRYLHRNLPPGRVIVLAIPMEIRGSWSCVRSFVGQRAKGRTRNCLDSHKECLRTTSAAASMSYADERFPGAWFDERKGIEMDRMVRVRIASNNECRTIAVSRHDSMDDVAAKASSVLKVSVNGFAVRLERGNRELHSTSEISAGDCLIFSIAKSGGMSRGRHRRPGACNVSPRRRQRYNSGRQRRSCRDCFGAFREW